MAHAKPSLNLVVNPLMGTRGNDQPRKGREAHLIGMIAEGHFTAFASRQGWHLYRGVDGHTSFDFIADAGDRLLRVEVKRIESVQHTHRNYYYVTTDIGAGSPDYAFVSTPFGWYWIPGEALPRKTLSIKLPHHVAAELDDVSYQREITRDGKYERYRVDYVK